MVLGVSPARRAVASVLLEALGDEGANAREQREPHPAVLVDVALQHRLVDETFNRVEHLPAVRPEIEDGLGGDDVEAAFEDAGLGERGALGLGQERPRRVDRFGERRVASGAAAEHGQRSSEARPELLEAEHAQASRSELDRERHAFEAADDLGDEVGRRALDGVAGPGGPGPVDEEIRAAPASAAAGASGPRGRARRSGSASGGRSSITSAPRPSRILDVTTNTTGDASSQTPIVAGAERAEVLELVEEQQLARSPGEDARDVNNGIADRGRRSMEGVGDRERDVAGGARSRELHDLDVPARERAARERSRELARESGLPDAGRPGDRHQARARDELGLDRGEVERASEERVAGSAALPHDDAS